MHPSHPRCPTHTLTLDPLPCKCNTPCQLRFRGSSIMYRRQFVQFKCVDGRKSAQVPTPWLESRRSSPSSFVRYGTAPRRFSRFPVSQPGVRNKKLMLGAGCSILVQNTRVRNLLCSYCATAQPDIVEASEY